MLAEFQASLSLSGDHKRGEAVYRRECLKCHRLSSREHPIGPNLIRGSEKDPESLLVNILDPNRFVETQYLQYVATDLKGGLYTGLLMDETATSVTLVEGDDLRNTLLRENIREIRATTNSLMPEGLEETINHQEMADRDLFHPQVSVRGRHRERRHRLRGGSLRGDDASPVAETGESGPAEGELVTCG